MNHWIQIAVGISIAGIIYWSFTDIQNAISFFGNACVGASIGFFIARKRQLNVYNWGGLGFAMGIFVVPFVLFWKKNHNKIISA